MLEDTGKASPIMPDRSHRIGSKGFYSRHIPTDQKKDLDMFGDS